MIRDTIAIAVVIVLLMAKLIWEVATLIRDWRKGKL